MQKNNKNSRVESVPLLYTILDKHTYSFPTGNHGQVHFQNIGLIFIYFITYKQHIQHIVGHRWFGG